MILIELVNKKKAVDALAEKHFNNFATVKAIYSLKKRVQEEFDFYVGEERKLIEEYADKDETGIPKIEDNLIKFKTPEDKDKYVELIENLYNTNIDIDKITIKVEDFRDELPTPKELDDLDLFINWE